MYQQGYPQDAGMNRQEETPWYAPPPRRLGDQDASVNPAADVTGEAPRARRSRRSRSVEKSRQQSVQTARPVQDTSVTEGPQQGGYSQPDYADPAAYQQQVSAPQQNSYSQPGYGDPNMGYQQQAYAAPQSSYAQPAYGDPNMGYQQQAYAAPQSGYVQPGYGDPNVGYQQQAYAAQQSSYLQPGYGDPNVGYQQQAYAAQQSGYAQPGYGDPAGYQQQAYAAPQSGYTQPGYGDPAGYQQQTYAAPQSGYPTPQSGYGEQTYPQSDDDYPPEYAHAYAPEQPGDDEPPRKKKPSVKWMIIRTVLVLVALAVGLIVADRWKLKTEAEPYLSVFLPNVYVDGINLSGMSFEAGSQAVWSQANAKQTGWYVRLKNEAGASKDITADMLGISFDPTAALQQAWAIGHTPDEKGQIDLGALRDTADEAKRTRYDFSSAQQSADTTPIDNILKTLQENAYRSPQDAVILSFNPDDFVNPFTFQQEIWGQWLDTAAVKDEILGMVSTLQSGEVLLKTTPIPPNVTVADLQKTVTLLCRAVTPIASSSTEDRTNNIRVAFAKINGKSFAHGDKFSFNKLVGRRSVENGFFEAIEYAYGEEVMGVGGGVCQASTTVYLAAVQSGMKITSREAHSNPVSYTSLGMDATVSDTRGREVDFAFKNESGGRIFIAAHVVQSGANGRSLLCEVRIYGPSLENVHYKLESETVEVLQKPEEPELKQDKNGEHVIYTDQTKLYSKGREGYVVDTYLCTYNGDELVSREKLHRDTYPARADKMWVGTTPRVN